MSKRFPLNASAFYFFIDWFFWMLKIRRKSQKLMLIISWLNTSDFLKDVFCSFFEKSEKISPNTWLRIFKIVFLPMETRELFLAIEWKFSKNNSRKAWQAGLQNCIFATGNASPNSALSSYLHLISYLLISTNILPLPR